MNYISTECGFLYWLISRAKQSYCCDHLCESCIFNKNYNGHNTDCDKLSQSDELEILYHKYETL